nr:hypothetical protein [Tanacetum cinerariifolium]
MDRDTIQLETAMSTISHEYLLEFTSEYGILEDVHPDLPGLEDMIVDFLEDIEDPDAATESSGTPFAIEKSSLYFDNKNSASRMTEGAASEVIEEEVAAMEPRSSKKHGRRGNDGADANAPPKVMRKYYVSVRPKQSTCGGKCLPTMRTAATPEAKHDLVLRDSDRKCGYHGSARHALCEKCRVKEINSLPIHVPPGYFSELRHMPNVEFLSQYNKNLAQHVAMGSQLRLRFEQEVRLLKKARAQIVRQDQRIQVKEEEIKKLDQEI